MKIKFVRTCCGCPEIYDAFMGDERVGILRVRDSIAVARCPYMDGQIVYYAATKGDGLLDYNERDGVLQGVAECIVAFLSKEPTTFEVTELG